jgi:uncharacterized MAPEG superfamily protein
VILLSLSVLLLLAHIGLQSILATRELGSDWNAGPRDGDRQPKAPLAGRAARASANFRETYPAFIGLLLGLAFMGDPNGIGIMGGWIWLIARIVYIPLYLQGIRYVRSLAWLVSIAGLLVMMAGLLIR